MATKTNTLLRRYTSLPAALHMLQTKSITLLSPGTWDDRNDRFFMTEYRRQTEVKSVLALCFTSADETYHHWRVFTHGSDGVCITFQHDPLVSTMKKYGGVQARFVRYKKIKEVREFRPSIPDLPFLKRQPYADEREFRLVYTDAEEELEAKSFSIEISSIKRITLNPWLPKPLVGVVKKAICSVDSSCKEIEVYQTSLLENEQWKRAATRSESKPKPKKKFAPRKKNLRFRRKKK